MRSAQIRDAKCKQLTVIFFGHPEILVSSPPPPSNGSTTNSGRLLRSALN